MGMSERNLWDMMRFYTRFHLSDSKLRQAVAVLPWWNINNVNPRLYLENVMYYGFILISPPPEICVHATIPTQSIPTIIQIARAIFSHFLSCLSSIFMIGKHKNKHIPPIISNTIMSSNLYYSKILSIIS